MRKILNSLNKKAVFAFAVLMVIGTLSMQAQLVLPGDDGQINDAPIDGFIITGLIAGAALGIRKGIKGLKK